MAPSVTPAVPLAPVGIAQQQHPSNVDSANQIAINAALYKAMMDQNKGLAPQGPTMADISNYMLTQGSSACYRSQNPTADFRTDFQRCLQEDS